MNYKGMLNELAQQLLGRPVEANDLRYTCVGRGTGRGAAPGTSEFVATVALSFAPGVAVWGEPCRAAAVSVAQGRRMGGKCGRGEGAKGIGDFCAKVTVRFEINFASSYQ